jgi:hypothetical protein
MLFPLNGGADLMREERWNPNVINQLDNSCQRIVEALLYGWKLPINHLQSKVIGKRVFIDINLAGNVESRI